MLNGKYISRSSTVKTKALRGMKVPESRRKWRSEKKCPQIPSSKLRQGVKEASYGQYEAVFQTMKVENPRVGVAPSPKGGRKWENTIGLHSSRKTGQSDPKFRRLGFLEVEDSAQNNCNTPHHKTGPIFNQGHFHHLPLLNPKNSWNFPENRKSPSEVRANSTRKITNQ